jgi:transketolase
LDRNAIIRAAAETRAIITVEEHQVGGLGNRVAAVIATEPSLGPKRIPFDMIGIEDRFGESGQPWQLIKKFGLSAEQIAQRAKKLADL